MYICVCVYIYTFISNKAYLASKKHTSGFGFAPMLCEAPLGRKTWLLPERRFVNKSLRV